jgi:acetylornithine deacetylase/succinyl-diaminopimelate desuccinylase-like protein
VNKAQLKFDVEYLAGHLIHRGASTHSERAAAEYIQDRLQVWTLNSSIDDFHTHGNTHLLFALYFAEFLVVAILAHLMPWLGFAYGLVVFGMFFAEYSGYELLGRFLPRFDTQNVSARFLSAQPQRTVVVTAHYDSPKMGMLHGDTSTSRWIHIASVIAMLVVLLSCAMEGFGLFADWQLRPDFALRWSGALILGSLGLRLVMVDSQSDYLRGAIDNASGVAALLGLAQAFTERPPERTDVLLVATGSNDAWMSGMRRLLSAEALEKDRTYFIDIDEVANGQLAYAAKSGAFGGLRPSKDLVALAKSVAPKLRVRKQGSAMPSDAYMALARGYKALAITTVPDKRTPDGWTEYDDRPGEIDYDTVAEAGDLVEGIVRRFDKH